MKLTVILILFSTAAVALEFEPYYEADLPNLAVKITKDEQGNFIEVTVNEWHDSVYTKEGHKNYIFQQGYDYSRKEGFIRTYSPERTLINETYSYRYDGMVVREEMLQAFELFKTNADVLKLLSAVNEPITLHGGFNFEDENADMPCYPGNRCVHVFASTPSVAVVAHSIVKLADKTVPYPAYDTDTVTHEMIETRMKNIRKNREKL